jgi:hypothetical protein
LGQDLYPLNGDYIQLQRNMTLLLITNSRFNLKNEQIYVIQSNKTKYNSDFKLLILIDASLNKRTIQCNNLQQYTDVCDDSHMWPKYVVLKVQASEFNMTV